MLQSFYEYQTYKWVVLDGDIDAVWIESMNTVMDDNKVRRQFADTWLLWLRRYWVQGKILYCSTPKECLGASLTPVLALAPQVLTLVSNERVPLSDAMRMVFEINSLKNATPATVSRAGILFINETGEHSSPPEYPGTSYPLYQLINAVFFAKRPVEWRACRSLSPAILLSCP